MVWAGWSALISINGGSHGRVMWGVGQRVLVRRCVAHVGIAQRRTFLFAKRVRASLKVWWNPTYAPRLELWFLVELAFVSFDDVRLSMLGAANVSVRNKEHPSFPAMSLV
jgi:hypothetical protein